MNKTYAEKILELENEPIVDKTLIRQRFRNKAKETHPDKFQTEPKKLKYTREFIRINEAYLFLLDFIETNGSYSTENNNGDVNADHPPEQEAENIKDIYPGKKVWYQNLFLLLFPGMAFPALVYLFFYELVRGFKECYGFLSFFFLVLNVLVVTIIVLASLFFLGKHAIEGKLLSQIIIVQIFFSIIYYVACFFIRKFLLRKFRNSLAVVN